MANTDWEDELDNADDGSQLVKKLRAQLKAQAKDLAERDERLNSLSKKVRQTEVKDILKEVGVNPKIARWVLNDVEDVTKESVQGWVAENGEFFGISQDAPEAQAQAAPQGMSDAEATNLTQITQFSAPDVSDANPQLSELGKRIDNVQNAEELTELLKLNRTNAF